MDDDADHGRKKNTERDFKPEHANRKDHAPRGATARPAAGMAAPGLGTSSSRQARYSEAQDQVKSHDVARDEDGRIQFRKGQEQGQTAKDQPPAFDPNKGIAISTGDVAHDKELSKDHNVITRAQAEELLGKDTVARKFYDEPGAAPGQSSEPENTSDADKQKAKELFDQLKKQRDRDKDLGR